MVGELRLDSAVVPIGRDSTSALGVRGVFIRKLPDGEEPPRIEFPAMAAFRPDGQVLITFRAPARCPCPVYELVGPLEDSEVRGHSFIAYTDFTHRGRFTLRRLAAP
jgi:hypothetical protein